ncbi:MAG: hypothetical protein IKU81_05985 [Oscillibacter sp.]|nr:hypothetical protein [Oscillibacter sp.]
MMEDLLPAIRDSKIWLQQFSRRDYSSAFEAYCRRFAPAYMEAAQKAEDEDAIERLAEVLLRAAETAWMAAPVWKQNGFRYGTKNMLLVYLSPMLLRMNTSACTRLAEILCQQWAARQAKDAYEIVTYEELRDGFKSVLPGLSFGGNSHTDRNRK